MLVHYFTALIPPSILSTSFKISHTHFNCIPWGDVLFLLLWIIFAILLYNHNESVLVCLTSVKTFLSSLLKDVSVPVLASSLPQNYKPSSLTLFVVSRRSPHTRTRPSINYQLSARRWGLSCSSTRTRQTLVTFLGRSFLKEPKQRWWQPPKGHAITRGVQPTPTQTSLYPHYMQLFGALCGACCSPAEHGELSRSTQRRCAWPRLQLSDYVLVGGKQMPALSCTPCTSRLSTCTVCAFQ